MAESNNVQKNVFSENDTLDINELASLNNDISPEFIEQLQNQVTQNANSFSENVSAENDDSELFEEINKPEDAAPEPAVEDTAAENDNLEDAFAKKFKAKQNKANMMPTEEKAPEAPAEPEPVPAPIQETVQEEPVKEDVQTETETSEAPQQAEAPIEDKKEIENLTSGNITEKQLTDEQKKYNESLDYLDSNVKYSKYVVYIDPENKDFIDSLTVKERKNLINRIIREQDDIAITKRRLSTIQTIIKHVIIAIITISVSIPVIYMTINMGLEATINNQKRSQTLFQTLYREHGKIQTNVK